MIYTARFSEECTSTCFRWKTFLLSVFLRLKFNMIFFQFPYNKRFLSGILYHSQHPYSANPPNFTNAVCFVWKRRTNRMCDIEVFLTIECNAIGIHQSITIVVFANSYRDT